MLSLPGLGEKQVRALRALGVDTREKARRRADEPAVAAQLRPAARAELLYRPAASIPRTVVDALADRLRNCLYLRGGPRVGRGRLIPVGSARRRKARSKDVDLLLVLPDREKGRAGLERLDVRPSCSGSSPGVDVLFSYAAGGRRRSFVVAYRPGRGRPGRGRYRVDVFLAYDSEKPYALFHHTGSAGYNVRVRSHAKRRGLKLNQYGLFRADTGRRAPGTASIRTERDLANYLGVTYREPADRA